MRTIAYPRQSDASTFPRMGTASYMVADSPAALVGLVQMGVLELQTRGSSGISSMSDRMILDLDPDPAVEWSAVIEGAQLFAHLAE